MGSPSTLNYVTPQHAVLPGHVAIIMDGNGRWAAERKISTARGHSQGGEAFRNLIEACKERPFITHLTFYAFSIENWERPAEEVNDLMNLLRHYMKREAPLLNENNIRVRFIGELSSLAPDIQRDLADVEKMTANNTRLTVTMAVSYGARQEIRRAMQLLGQKIAEGTLAPEQITEAMIEENLYTHDMPKPDLIIRTAGEQRLSNFLLWQSAYAEFYYDDVLWPDYKLEHLDRAIEAYSKRERRFGLRKEQLRHG